CACCRRVWAHLGAASRRLVEAAERFADGLVPPSELDEARDRWARVDSGDAEALWAAQPGIERAAGMGLSAAGWTAGQAAAEAAGLRLTPQPSGGPVVQGALLAERRAQASLVRDVAGSRSRRPRVETGWLTPTVTRLAAAGYERRALPSGQLESARLAVLA